MKMGTSELPAYKKHQHRDYKYKTVHIVYAATKPTTSTYCNYNTSQLTFYSVYFIINYINILIF